jgi:serine/threonine-protein kinase
MGEVYRAHDTRLQRDVAIKVLPSAFSVDPKRVARFEREARTLASLNHPNIAQIHGLEEADGVKALVMELVEGPTLADRIAQGPIPLDEALPIAKQIAEALEAAHERGIIHRDLKPANIALAANDQVKVLDFGLAKLAQPEGLTSSDPSVSTITSPAMLTGVGMILGTAAYMSPEQAKGRVVDKRSDVWAFGAVLYEMLTARRAFEGDDVSDTLARILMKEPDWTALPGTVPAAVVTVIRRCLQKDRQQRVRDIGDVSLALAGAFDAPSPALPIAASATIPVPRARWPIVLPWAFIVGGLAAAGVVWSISRPLPAPLERFVITTPVDAPPAFRAPVGVIAMSRDGAHLVYRSSPPAELITATNGRLYLRARGQLEPTPMRGTEGAMSPFFSADGQWIAFGSGIDFTLKRISVQGGPAQTICPIEGLLLGGTWGTDDTIVFATANSNGLRRVPAAGGVPQLLTKVDPTSGESAHGWPDFLPDGKSVVFTSWTGSAERSRISVVSLADGHVSVLISGGTQPHVTPTGHLLFAVGGAVQAVRFDPVRRSIAGSPVPVVEGVAIATAGAAHYAVAADGTLVYVSGTSGPSIPPRTMFWVDRQGGQEAINVPPGAYTYARLSPDGTRVALDARDRQNDIWIWDLKRETLLRLTTDPGFNRGPVWTPDSQRVAFSAQRQGAGGNIYWQAADGSGVPERLTVSETIQTPSSFSPDGKRLVFMTPLTPPTNLGVLSLDDHKEALLVDTSFDELNGVLSPDGRWLAYQSNESGSYEIYLAPFPDVHASKRPVSTGGGTRPLWSQDGRELFYYVEPGTIMAVPMTPGADLTLGRPAVVVKGPYASPRNSGRHYDVSRDGKRFLLLKDVETSGSTKPPPPEIRLVLHWLNELERLVPPK